MIWYDMTRYDMIWYDMIYYDTLWLKRYIYMIYYDKNAMTYYENDTIYLI